MPSAQLTAGTSVWPLSFSVSSSPHKASTPLLLWCSVLSLGLVRLIWGPPCGGVQDVRVRLPWIASGGGEGVW